MSSNQEFRILQLFAELGIIKRALAKAGIVRPKEYERTLEEAAMAVGGLRFLNYIRKQRSPI